MIGRNTIKTAQKQVLTRLSPPDDKIELFRSLFKGRSDVYPLRFESQRTGRSGYQPACANEWVRLLCDKPRIKCFDCTNRSFLPVTDEVIHSHLSGHDSRGNDFVIGLYPMLLDDCCYFLAVDFDRDCWQEDSLAFVATCEQFKIPCALERSRSGNGAHVWFFFSEALPAIKARQLGSYLLTRTMEQHPGIGLRSYDRLFPNQDTLPKGGFGNLIALPLQGKAREQGNSVFIDQNLKPHEDQWSFLSSVKKISLPEVNQLTEEANQRGRIIGVSFVSSDEDNDQPWTALPSRKHKEPAINEPLPAQLNIILADQLYIPKKDLPPPLLNRLIRLAAFQNPEFYRA
ncbi:MAG: restriction endonuclease subunit R, partial [Verrucomicrobia bacterium]|nr:restriction endonuclease subunit R [Verrucomicrobiota bacterium]